MIYGRVMPPPLKLPVLLQYKFVEAVAAVAGRRLQSGPHREGGGAAPRSQPAAMASSAEAEKRAEFDEMRGASGLQTDRADMAFIDSAVPAKKHATYEEPEDHWSVVLKRLAPAGYSKSPVWQQRIIEKVFRNMTKRQKEAGGSRLSKEQMAHTVDLAAIGLSAEMAAAIRAEDQRVAATMRELPRLDRGGKSSNDAELSNAAKTLAERQNKVTPKAIDCRTQASITPLRYLSWMPREFHRFFHCSHQIPVLLSKHAGPTSSIKVPTTCNDALSRMCSRIIKPRGHRPLPQPSITPSPNPEPTLSLPSTPPPHPSTELYGQVFELIPPPLLETHTCASCRLAGLGCCSIQIHFYIRAIQMEQLMEQDLDNDTKQVTEEIVNAQTGRDGGLVLYPSSPLIRSLPSCSLHPSPSVVCKAGHHR